jgi:cytochrome b involved in lipid metabolism
MPVHRKSTQPIRILVVGGGIAGLATAHRLLNDSRWQKHHIHITLTERKGRYGGRVKSMSCENKDDGWYEAGASRVADTHHRVRALARTVGCKEVALPESYDQRSVMPSTHTRFRHIHKLFVDSHGESALKSVTWWDVLTIVCDAVERNRLVQRWGFLSVLTQMNAHDFWHYAMPQYLCKMYYTFDGGLQRLTDGLVSGLQHQERVELKPSTKVVSVDWVTSSTPEFTVTMQDDRDSSIYHAHHERVYTRTFDLVFLALPAEALAVMKGLPEAHEHYWTSVTRNRLIRCYAKYNSSAPTIRSNITRKNRRNRRSLSPASLCRSRVKSSILSKCTTTHAPAWQQISYCDHTHADHIYNILRMPDGLAHFKSVVRQTLGEQWASFDDRDFDVHFWKAGTHSWKPQLVSDAHYDRALQPDAKIPMFVVGASLSHYQHWMEGALETVDDAYKKCWRYAVEWMGLGKKNERARAQVQSSKHTPPFYLHNACANAEQQYTIEEVCRNEWVVLDGYVYDIQPILDRHPGGRSVLQMFVGKDISIAYHRIGHSGVARAWVEEHCKGVLRVDAVEHLGQRRVSR